MPTKKNYSLVPNNEFDLRIPLHSDEAFQHGITFQAQYIGSLDVPRPNSRMEIVAAMRRIRYEFKAKGVKKKKVLMDVSVDGVRVSLRRKPKKKKEWPLDDSTLLLMHHPVYRIFYVSHDSQDLKIFSYIARDASSNFFRCNVFKTHKKSQAMKIVRTVGQAFEVCHKLTAVAAPSSPSSGRAETEAVDEFSDQENDQNSDVALSLCDQKPRKDLMPGDSMIDGVPEEILNLSLDARAKSTDPSERPARLELVPQQQQQQTLHQPPQQQQQQQQIQLQLQALQQQLETQQQQLQAQQQPFQIQQAQQHQQQQQQQLQMQQQQQQQQLQIQQQQQQLQMQQSQQQQQQQQGHVTPATPLALHHEVLLLKQQVEQQQQQTQAAIAQVKLLQDQLAAETAARMEAQARTHQLLVHNKELLDHIQTLVIQMQELESKVQGGSNLQPGSGPGIPPPMMLQSNRLPTLREVDCLQESSGPSVSNHVEMQQQLQQQQQQYAILLSQSASQQPPQQQQLNALLHTSMSPMSPTAIGHAPLFTYGLQNAIPGIRTPPTPRHSSPNSSYASLSQVALGGNPSAVTGSPTQSQIQLAGSGMFQANVVSPSGATFILPLAESNDKSGSYDSGLGSGHLAVSQGALEVIRRLQLIGEDTSAGAGSLASLHSSDSDRQRMDSSQESMGGGIGTGGMGGGIGTGGMGGNAGRPLLPTLHQQLEHLRLGNEGDDRMAQTGTLRRNGPFITRSTSEKMPHRNEILAQVQRTAWARHTTK